MTMLAAALLALAPLQEGEAKVHRGLPYRLYKPAAVEAGARLPLVVFLHGAGERGSDNQAQTKHGVPAFLKLQAKTPHFLIAPQCPSNKRWVEVDWSAAAHTTLAAPSEPMGALLDLLPVLLKELPIDAARVYVTGLSMGGYGTWDALVRRPDLFAAGAPVCGGGDETAAARIAKIPQWIVHGDQDNVVKTDRSRHMVEALKKAGGAPRYTELPGVGHNAWDKAYADPEFFTWLFSQKKK